MQCTLALSISFTIKFKFKKKEKRKGKGTQNMHIQAKLGLSLGSYRNLTDPFPCTRTSSCLSYKKAIYAGNHLTWYMCKTSIRRIIYGRHKVLNNYLKHHNSISLIINFKNLSSSSKSPEPSESPEADKPALPNRTFFTKGRASKSGLEQLPFLHSPALHSSSFSLILPS